VPRTFAGPLLVTVAYVVVYDAMIVNQLLVRTRRRREDRARGRQHVMGRRLGKGIRNRILLPTVIGYLVFAYLVGRLVVAAATA